MKRIIHRFKKKQDKTTFKLTGNLALTDVIRQHLDNIMYTEIVILDLQKAFDTVDHKILSC